MNDTSHPSIINSIQLGNPFYKRNDTMPSMRRFQFQISLRQKTGRPEAGRDIEFFVPIYVYKTQKAPEEWLRAHSVQVVRTVLLRTT